eukprot:g1695.t1
MKMNENKIKKKRRRPKRGRRGKKKNKAEKRVAITKAISKAAAAAIAAASEVGFLCNFVDVETMESSSSFAPYYYNQSFPLFQIPPQQRFFPQSQSSIMNFEASMYGMGWNLNHHGRIGAGLAPRYEIQSSAPPPPAPLSPSLKGAKSMEPPSPPMVPLFVPPLRYMAPHSTKSSLPPSPLSPSRLARSRTSTFGMDFEIDGGTALQSESNFSLEENRNNLLNANNLGSENNVLVEKEEDSVEATSWEQQKSVHHRKISATSAACIPGDLLCESSSYKKKDSVSKKQQGFSSSKIESNSSSAKKSLGLFGYGFEAFSTRPKLDIDKNRSNGLVEEHDSITSDSVKRLLSHEMLLKRERENSLMEELFYPRWDFLVDEWQQERLKQWVLWAEEEERRLRVAEYLLDVVNLGNDFQLENEEKEKGDVICLFSSQGCDHTCPRDELVEHMATCPFRLSFNDDVFQEKARLEEEEVTGNLRDYEVMCPFSASGCEVSCPLSSLANHMASCKHNPQSSYALEEASRERMLQQQLVLAQVEKERRRRLSSPRFQRMKRRAKEISVQKTTMNILSLQQRLDCEICKFQQFCNEKSVSYEPFEKKAVQLVHSTVQRLWPQSRRAVLFGSRATSLALPSSDIDIVIVSEKKKNFGTAKFSEEKSFPEKKISNVELLAVALEDENWIEKNSIQVIRATVPVIKLIALLSIAEETVKRVSIDITFECDLHSGVKTVKLVRNLATTYPALRPLVLILKQLLFSKKLSNPYSGGLGSYALVLMVASLLQQRRSALQLNLNLNINSKLKKFDENFEKNENFDFENRPITPLRDADAVAEAVAARIFAKLPGSPKVKAQHWDLLSAVHSTLPDSVVNKERHAGAMKAIIATLPDSVENKETHRRNLKAVHVEFSQKELEENSNSNSRRECLGALLMEFLQVYGRDFDPSSDFVAVQLLPQILQNQNEMSNHINYQQKQNMNFNQQQARLEVDSTTTGAAGVKFKNDAVVNVSVNTVVDGDSNSLSFDSILVITDPLNPANNVGRSSFRFRQVQHTFTQALVSLLMAMRDERNDEKTLLKETGFF